MAKARAQQLFEAGLEHLDFPTKEEVAMLRAFAQMLDVATAPKKKRASPVSREHRDYGMRVYEGLKAKVPKAILYTPCEDRTFGQLGKTLTSAGVTPRQIYMLIEWLKTNPFHWRDNTPTWNEFCSKVLSWIAQAEEAMTKNTNPASDALALAREEGL